MTDLSSTFALPVIAAAPERGLVVAAASAAAALDSAAAEPGWPALVDALDTLLRQPVSGPQWLPQLLALRERALQAAQAAPDAALLQLVYRAAVEPGHYSSRHALLCMLVAADTARALHWPASRVRSLTLAALTMNTAMHGLQDRLATQAGPMSAGQREAVADHAQRAAEALRAAGVTDADWIAIVQAHHDEHGDALPLAALAPAWQAARLLRRVDRFIAALSCRQHRPALTPSQAVRLAGLGPDGLPDDIGTALIASVGLYPPGSAVQLRDGACALVLGRGPRANLPELALLTRADGSPLPRPVPASTHHQPHAVRGDVPLAQLRLLPDLAQLLALLPHPLHPPLPPQ